MFTNDLQSLKASDLILVTFDGISICSNDSHWENKKTEIFLKEHDEIETCFNDLHPLKAPLLIFIMLDGNIISFKDAQLRKVFLPILLIHIWGNMNSSRDVQSLKASLSIQNNFSGSSTFFNDVHPSNNPIAI